MQLTYGVVNLLLGLLHSTTTSLSAFTIGGTYVARGRVELFIV